jgi:hypothetical protein
MMRRFLPRFSLLTAIVLLFTAGCLAFLNIRHTEEKFAVTNSITVSNLRYGWPVLYFDWFDELQTVDVRGNYHHLWRFDYKFALLDLAIALAILIVAGIISETIVRRRERKVRLNSTPNSE